MASGLIYLVIIGMWVAYFLPRWLNNRDHATGRSAEKYKSAIKMVSEDFAITPPKPDKALKQKQLKIRRFGFLTVLISFVVATVTATIGATSVLIELIPVSAFAIYVVAVRRQVVANQLRQRRLNVITQITKAQLPGIQTPKVFDQHEIYSEVEVKSNWIEFSDEEKAGVNVVSKGSSEINNEDSPSWSPIQVPTPTYLSAPKAFTPKRIIDLTTPGQWSAEHSHDTELERYLDEQSIMPKRVDGFAADLKAESARDHDQAAGQ